MISVFLKTGALWAQQRDSVSTSTKTDIVNAGWLRQWEGVPTQWFGTPQGGVEVSGYANMDKKIRFFKNGTFEIDIYKDCLMPFLTVTLFNECCPCRKRRDDEMTVLTGTWVVKRDSVFLSYRWENIYKIEPYVGHRARKEQGLHPNSRSGIMSSCAFRIKETYFWQNGKLCFGETSNQCYK